MTSSPRLLIERTRLGRQWLIHDGTLCWHPPTDVYETDEHLVVVIEIAGIDSRNCRVQLHEGVLRISGRRTGSSMHRTYHHMEISLGHFEVAIAVGDIAAETPIALEYDRGFLVAQLTKGQLLK